MMAIFIEISTTNSKNFTEKFNRVFVTIFFNKLNLLYRGSCKKARNFFTISYLTL